MRPGGGHSCLDVTTVRDRPLQSSSGMQPFPGSTIDWLAAEPRNRQSYLEPRGVTPARLFAVRMFDGMTMNIAPHRTVSTPLSNVGGGAAVWPAFRYFGAGLIWLPLAVLAGLSAWMLSGYASSTAESEPAQLTTAARLELTQIRAIEAAQERSWFNPAATPVEAMVPAQEATAPAEAAPVDGLKISSQSWRRGGLGSNALISFTLRNANEYAVKDIEIFCAFTRRDGSHLTDRKRVINDTVHMKSQKKFARVHVGFVNVNANRAKCSLVTASRS
jgi:hypothetical protein